MSSCQTIPFDVDATPSKASFAPSRSTLLNAFGRLISGSGRGQLKIKRDQCKRPTPEYNHNYNPFETPSNIVPSSYMPYEGEPI
jgi:hypothetical protein